MPIPDDPDAIRLMGESIPPTSIEAMTNWIQAERLAALGIPQPEAQPVVAQSDAISRDNDQVRRVTAIQADQVNANLDLFRQEALEQARATRVIQPGRYVMEHAQAPDAAELEYINRMESITNSLKAKCERLYQELEEAYGTINLQDQMLLDLRAKVKELLQPAPFVRAKLDTPLKPHKE